MQRGVGSIRVTYRGTHYVAAAGSARSARLLSRGHARISPSTPRAARAAAERDPLGALRRSARSLSPAHSVRPAAGARLDTMPMRWVAARRGMPDPRSWCARPRPD